jgi:hypothetical protein
MNQTPKERAMQYLGWVIETIYPFKNNLFIGRLIRE